MKLIIENINDTKFISYLISTIKSYLLYNYNYRKAQKLEDYLNTIPKFKSKFRRYISVKELIMIAAYNLRYKKFSSYYEITIDQNQKVFGIDAKLYDICRLINFGTLDVNGYSIFSDAFNYVEENINTLYSLYRRVEN